METIVFKLLNCKYKFVLWARNYNLPGSLKPTQQFQRFSFAVKRQERERSGERKPLVAGPENLSTMLQ